MNATNVKRVIAAVSALLALSGCAEEIPADFRDTNWGMSPAAVAKKEPSEYVFADDEIMIFGDSWNGEQVDISYTFADGGLAEAQMNFTMGERTILESTAVYDSLSLELTEKYGQPLNPEKRVWLTDIDEVADKEDRLALYNHDMTYLMEWETETTYAKAVLECVGQNNIVFYYYACDISRRAA
jgi:hypothetical protein